MQNVLRRSFDVKPTKLDTDDKKHPINQKMINKAMKSVKNQNKVHNKK